MRGRDKGRGRKEKWERAGRVVYGGTNGWRKKRKRERERERMCPWPEMDQTPRSRGLRQPRAQTALKSLNASHLTLYLRTTYPFQPREPPVWYICRRIERVNGFRMNPVFLATQIEYDQIPSSRGWTPSSSINTTTSPPPPPFSRGFRPTLPSLGKSTTAT